MNYTIYNSDGSWLGTFSTVVDEMIPVGGTSVEGVYSKYTRYVNGAVVNFAQSEADAITNEALSVEIRVERDELLRATDYVILPDAPYSTDTQTAYRTYRQALRDLPQQAGFPTNITWPAKPTR